MDLASRLKHARQSIDFTQDQAAEKLFVSRQTISNWENGHTLPDLTSLLLISETYTLSLDELIKGDQKMIDKVAAEQEELIDLRKQRTRKEHIIAGGIILTLLISLVIWGNYLFAYNPDVGAFPLLWCLLSGGIGIVFASFIQRRWLRWLFILINLLILLSLPNLFFISALLGF